MRESAGVDYYLKRQCRGKVQRRHRFLWWTWYTENYEYDPTLFGAYFIGPFPTAAQARDCPFYKPTDELVRADEMHPDLVACHREGILHGNHREQYFGVEELADPTVLLCKLREIWVKRREGREYTAEDRERWRAEIADAKQSKTREEFNEWLTRRLNSAR